MERAAGEASDAGDGEAPSLADRYWEMRGDAERIAGGPAGFFRRREALRDIEDECGANTVFPVVALREERAFVSFYADYHFTRRYGHDPAAAPYVDPALLCLLNRLHDAIARGDVLPEGIRRALFTTACAVYGRYNDEMLSTAAC